MSERANNIQSWIDVRIKREETTLCVFNIKIPADEEVDAEVKDILVRNNVKYDKRDTIVGSWNLNSDYYECEPVECIVEYCGVYPVHWNIEDVVKLEALCNTDKISIHVYWVVPDENGIEGFVPNN